MNENHRLIKDVSNALNFYMERTRREEGFDLSGVLRPAYDLNQFKFNKLFGYSTGYDTTMKKILMPQLCLPKSFQPESEEIKLREKFYKDELRYHLHMNRNRKNARPQTQKGYRSKSSNEFISHSRNGERKPRPKVPAGLLTIRSTHTPALTKREKLSMVNITSKIMSASSELCFQKEDILLMKSLADADAKKACYVRKSISQSRLEKQEEMERRYREYERQQMLKKQRKEEEEKNAQGEVSSPDTLENKSDSTNKSYEEETKEVIKIRPVSEAKIRSKTPSKSPESEEDIQKRKRDEKIRQLKDLKEIADGDLVKYRIVIKTGERLGSSTSATIRLRLFGSNGKTKQLKLKDSKTHKIPFRKGNTDVFDLSVFDIGKIKAIDLGHSAKNIESSWFIDYVGVENQTKSIVYTFETPDWFSTTSNDGLTKRILFKKTSASIDSAANSSSRSSSSSSSADSRSRSSSSSYSTSTVKSNKKSTSRLSKKSESSEIQNKKELVSDSSSSLSTSRPYSSSNAKKNESEHEEANTERQSESKRSRKASTSMSVRDAEDEIASKKFDFSPSHSETEFHKVDTTKVNMSIFEAVERNRLDILKEKLQMSPLDITKTDLSGRTLMILACEYGSENIARYLADNSDDLVNMDTPLGYFPVHICAQFNRVDCMKILYDVGASLHSKTNEGNTPLHIAAESGNLNIVKWLADHSANVTILNNSAETAYDLAKRNGHIEIANYLAEPSGIDKQLTEDDYTDVALLKAVDSPYTRPNEPSPEPEPERSASVRSTKLSSRKSSVSKKSSKISHRTVSPTSSSSSTLSSTSRVTSPASTTSSSDSDSSLKKRKAGSGSRINSASYKVITTKKISRSNSQAKESEHDSSRSRPNSQLNKKGRSSSKQSTQSKKSSDLTSNSSVSLASPSKTHSRQNSNDNARLTSSKSSSSNNTDSDSDTSLKFKKAGSANSSEIKLKSSKEVSSGILIKYELIIKTGNREGADIQLPVILTFYGSNGKSKEFNLKNSRSHQSAFEKGNTDIFDLEVHNIGSLKALNIGFGDKNINSSWYIDYIGVEDKTNKVIYTFRDCQCIGSNSKDGRTSRMILIKDSSATYDSDSSSSSSDDSITSSTSTATLKSARSLKSRTSTH